MSFLAVIASQRVGARRRPMTGSAKRYMSGTAEPHFELLRRFAPRNDGCFANIC
jgi:hypothetical protein